jgi:hypothetical protein
MSQDFKKGDEVIWTIPTNKTKLRAKIIREVRGPWAGEPPRTESSGPGELETWPALGDVEHGFEIELLPPGRGRETVPMSQLRHAT